MLPSSLVACLILRPDGSNWNWVSSGTLVNSFEGEGCSCCMSELIHIVV